MAYDRKRQIAVHATLALALLFVLGCIEPEDTENEMGGPDLLVTMIRLDRESFDRYEEVSGMVEVHNPSDLDVSMYPFACPHFTLERKSDLKAFSVPCPAQYDVAGPSVLESGASRSSDFSFSHYDRQESDSSESVSAGEYGMRASAVLDAPKSAEVTFKITDGY